MRLPSKEDLIEKVAKELFSKPLVTNNFRSLLVEAMVDSALRPNWSWCSLDYAAWDFEHEDGTRLEIKQSAARQSWDAGPNGYSKPRYDIRERKMRWEGARKVEEVTRFADFYVFAFNPVIDETADHRDSSQWLFYPVRTADLPNQKTIGLSEIRRLTAPTDLVSLKERLSALLNS